MVGKWWEKGGIKVKKASAILNFSNLKMFQGSQKAENMYE